jgi:hypothetical protein
MELRRGLGRYLGLMVLSIFIAGCLPKNMPTAQVPSEPTSTMPALPMASPSPTTPPTTGIQLTPTLTVASQCIAIEDKAPNDLPRSGVWLRNEATPYLENVDGSGDKLVPLKGGGLFSTRPGDAAVSPNGKYVAYIDQYHDPVVQYQPTQRILRVIDSSGHSLQMDFWKQDWQDIIGWLDNDRLSLFTSNDGIITLNPFSGKWEKFPEPAWMIDQGYLGENYRFRYDPYAGRYQGPIFSPGLDEVVFPGAAGGDVKDLQSGELLFRWRITGSPWFDRQTLSWSANGAVLASWSDAQIEILREDNTVSRVELPQLPFNLDWVDGVQVSPNGKKVAVTGITYSTLGSSRRFLVYDETRSELYFLCTDKHGLGNTIVWSPDSRFLIVQIYDSSSQQSDGLVDTELLRAFKLTSGLAQHRLLWLAKP